MDLWNQLADAAPNPYMPLAGALLVLVVGGVLTMAVDAAPGPPKSGLVLILTMLLGAIVAPGAYVLQVAIMQENTATAIEQYLAHTRDLRVLDPIDVDLEARTAVAETVNEDGKRVTATIEWIDLDTEIASLGEDFEPLTVELITRADPRGDAPHPLNGTVLHGLGPIDLETEKAASLGDDFEPLTFELPKH